MSGLPCCPGRFSKSLCAVLFFVMWRSPTALADTYVFKQITEEAKAESNSREIVDGKPVGRIVNEDAKMNWKAPISLELTVRTGPSAMSIESPDRSEIYDFAAKRLYVLNCKEKTYMDGSLYALLAFRFAELGNRLVLGKIMSAALKGNDRDKTFDDFYSETILGVLLLPQYVGRIKGSEYKLDKNEGPEGSTYKYGAQVVTCFLPAGEKLSDSSMKELRRFYCYGCSIHPTIREDLEQSKEAPKELMYYVEQGGFSKRRVKLMLQSRNNEAYLLKLPANYKLTVSSDDDLLKPVRLKLQQLGGKPAADAKERTIADYYRFIGEKRYLDAYLTLSEWYMQSGINLGILMKPVVEKSTEDPEMILFRKGMEAPTSEEAARESLSALDSINRKVLEKSYLIDVFRGNLIDQLEKHSAKDIKTSGESRPVKCFVNALVANPFLTGAYHDLGNCLQRSFEQPLAWECFDIARRLYPDHPLMKDVNDQEAFLEKSLPQYF